MTLKHFRWSLKSRRSLHLKHFQAFLKPSASDFKYSLHFGTQFTWRHTVSHLLVSHNFPHMSLLHQNQHFTCQLCLAKNTVQRQFHVATTCTRESIKVLLKRLVLLIAQVVRTDVRMTTMCTVSKSKYKRLIGFLQVLSGPAGLCPRSLTALLKRSSGSATFLFCLQQVLYVRSSCSSTSVDASWLYQGDTGQAINTPVVNHWNIHTHTWLLSLWKLHAGKNREAVRCLCVFINMWCKFTPISM